MVAEKYEYGCCFAGGFSQTEIPIEDLMYSKNSRVASGLVFRLSETALLTKLEQLIHYIRGK